jgi:hypothetical protein
MKRIKSRIDVLESKQATGGLSRQESMLLVSLLGRRDALFWPWRFQIHSRIRFAEIRTRQREYLSGTVGIATKADGRHAWKDSHAMRQRLIAAGMATAVHSGGQVQSLFLTSLGEATARGLVGERTHCYHTSGIVVLVLLRRLSAMTSVKAVRESILFRHPCVGDPTSWNDLTEMILPCLTCGLVTASSDTQGRACYTPVDGVPEPPHISVDVASDDAYDEAYVDAFEDERRVLESCEARDPSEIIVPLPATGWGWECHFPKEFTE